MTPGILTIAYLVAASCFIMGIKWLNRPETARSGNMLSAAGMLLAISVTLLHQSIVSYNVIVAGLLVGGTVGLVLAKRVRMTAMPQMVALLNGFGGGTSFLVAFSEFLFAEQRGESIASTTNVALHVAVIVGAVTFSGSMIAFAKLQELMTGRPLTFPGQRVFNGVLFAVIVGLSVHQLISPDPLLSTFYLLGALTLLLGVMLVLPIGGADMPVVIALLNSLTGVAAAGTGFVLGNEMLVIAGALMGTAGLILTRVMCKAMNRSLANVLFSAFGSATVASTRDATGLTVRTVAAEDAAVQLAYAQSVIVVPGYGLAVAQAQHTVRELAEQVEKRGGTVRFAIHPVAGRMPGHMNVLLAEANVPYDKLVEMDDINPDFERTDVALVIGANDVVNPAARTDESSPIYGMPILNVDHARSVIVMKRSMSAGFAGIENELFYGPRTTMLFGDAKKSLSTLVQEIKSI